MPSMTQAELSAIWAKIVASQTVEGWGGHPYSDIDVLRRASPDDLWVRKKPEGRWVLCPNREY
jgi:hypothetical protein